VSSFGLFCLVVCIEWPRTPKYSLQKVVWSRFCWKIILHAGDFDCCINYVFGCPSNFIQGYLSIPKRTTSKFTLLNGFADHKTSPLEELQTVFTQKVDIAK
jgi:hypothetical protein